MATNESTAAQTFSSFQQQQQQHQRLLKIQGAASGRSLFWAMATLCLTCMLQPSFIGTSQSGNIFESSLWPHRSSPFVCSIDALFDLHTIIDKYRRPNRYFNKKATKFAKSTTVAMRITMFVLGTLPQAIKIFSTRGIPVTQGVAGVFFASSVVSLARTLHLEAPQEDIEDLAKRKATSTAPFWTLFLFGLVPHSIFLYLIWALIYDAITTRSKWSSLDQLRMVTILLPSLESVSSIVITICFVYLLQHIVLTIALGKWLIYRWAPLFIYVYADTLGLVAQLFACPFRQEEKKRAEGRQRYTLQLLFHAVLGSYFLAYVFGLCGRGLLAWSTRSRASGDSDQDVELAVSEQTSGVLRADHASDDPSVDYASRVSGSGTRQDAGTNDAGPGAGSQMPRLPHTENASVNNNNSSVTASDSNPTPVGETCEADRSKSTTGRVLNWMVDYPLTALVVPVGILLVYARLVDNHRDEDDTVERGDATGENNNQQATHASQEREHVPPLGFLRKALGRIVHYTLMLLSRSFFAMLSVSLYSWNWIEYKLKGHVEDRVWLAFAILNSMTALIVYMVIFDAEGTFSPNWISLLG